MNSFPIKQGFQPSFFSLVFYISTFFFYILISLVFIFSPFYIPPFLIYILFSSVFIFSSFYIPPFFFYILFSLVFIISTFYIPPFFFYILFSLIFIFSTFYIPPLFFYILFFFSFHILYFLFSTFTKGHIQLILKFGNVPPLSTVLFPSPWLFFSALCRLCAEYTERIQFFILSARFLTIKFITPRWLSFSVFMTKIFKVYLL